jgi:hypothetical protein
MFTAMDEQFRTYLARFIETTLLPENLVAKKFGNEYLHVEGFLTYFKNCVGNLQRSTFRPKSLFEVLFTINILLKVEYILYHFYTINF